MTKTAPTVAAAAVAAIMAADSMILSPGRGTRPRGFRVPLTDPTVSELAGPAGLVCCPARHVLFLCYVRASVLSRSAAARVEYSSFSSARHWATSAAMRCATSASETPRPVSAAVQQVSANEPRIPSVKFTTWI